MPPACRRRRRKINRIRPSTLSAGAHQFRCKISARLPRPSGSRLSGSCRLRWRAPPVRPIMCCVQGEGQPSALGHQPATGKPDGCSRTSNDNAGVRHDRERATAHHEPFNSQDHLPPVRGANEPLQDRAGSAGQSRPPVLRVRVRLRVSFVGSSEQRPLVSFESWCRFEALVHARRNIYCGRALSCPAATGRRQRRHAKQNGRTMSRNNVLYLVVGALVVAVAVLGYYQYQDHNKKQTSGLSINVGPAGIHVGGGSK
jgi:hypothetical protein